MTTAWSILDLHSHRICDCASYRAIQIYGIYSEAGEEWRLHAIPRRRLLLWKVDSSFGSCTTSDIACIIDTCNSHSTNTLLLYLLRKGWDKCTSFSMQLVDKQPSAQQHEASCFGRTYDLT